MPSTSFANWAEHQFYVYDPTTASWRDVPGVYIFATVEREHWKALYIGECESFATRLPPQNHHEKWAAAQRLGATSIHVRVEREGIRRALVEQVLIQRFAPPLNVQHNPNR